MVTHLFLLFVLARLDLIGIRIVGDCIPKRLACRRTLPENEGSIIFERGFDISVVDFWMLIDADANEVSAGRQWHSHYDMALVGLLTDQLSKSIDPWHDWWCFHFNCVSNSKSHEYETVPILRILETKDLHKLIPAIGCLYVIACSAALLEVFTETFQIIVRFATSEWKVLLKQISYESRESGSPVLAVFVCGSLVAILAFACPLQNMTFVIAGAQLTAGVLRSMYFLYAPFRPKSMNHKREHSTVNFNQRFN